VISKKVGYFDTDIKYFYWLLIYFYLSIFSVQELMKRSTTFLFSMELCLNLSGQPKEDRIVCFPAEIRNEHLLNTRNFRFKHFNIVTVTVKRSK
jgi:hypothetical protein